MNGTTARVELMRRVVPGCAARGRGERLANWLALIALLALGVVWH